MKTSKTLNSFRVSAFMWLVVGLLAAIDVRAQPALPEYGPFLNGYRFDTTNLLSYRGDPPNAAAGVQLVPTWQGNGARFTGLQPAYLNYPWIETNGWTNINLNPPRASIWFWYRPIGWSSFPLGLGPGSSARFFEMGAHTLDSSYSWLSLYLTPQGDRIQFAGQTNGQGAVFLDASVQWRSNEWHWIIVNFTTSNSTLHVDGVFLTNGLGVTYWPSPSVLSNGFFIGSDSSGTGLNLAQGDFEAFRIYGGLTPESIYPGYYSNTLAKIREWEGSGGGGAFGPMGPEGGGSGEGPESASSSSPCSMVTPTSGPSNALWLDISVCPTDVILTLHNSGPDTNYMFFSRTNVATGLWSLEAEAPGLVETNVASVAIALAGRPNLFFVAGVGSDVDGDGLPSAYESFVTGTDPLDGDTGDTGIPDGLKDADGDGWTNIDEFRNRQNPNSVESPPSLTGVFRTFDTNNLNVIEWSPSSATPTSFTIERKSGSTWETVATVAGDASSFTDTNLPPGTSAEYRVRANYASVSTAFASTETVAPGTTDASLSIGAAVARGPGGRLYYTAYPSADSLAFHRIYRYGYPSPHPKNYIWEVTTNYPYTGWVATPQNVIGLLSAAAASNSPVIISTNFFPHHGWYLLSFQAEGKDGRLGNSLSESIYYDATPYLAGYQHMLENVSFGLRAGDANAPFNFYFDDFRDRPAQNIYGLFPSYAVAPFGWMGHFLTFTPEILDPYRPFEDNAIFRNFCFDINRFDGYGNPTTGIRYTNSGITLMNWTHNFNSLTYAQAGRTDIPAGLLDTNGSQYIYYRRASYGDDLSAIGLLWDDSVPGWTMMSGARNYYGLPFLSVRAVRITPMPDTLAYYTATPGGTIPALSNAHFFVETEFPTLNTVGFHFTEESQRDGPGNGSWSGVIKTNQFVIGFGKRLTLAAWAKKAIQNGYADKSGYVQLYFDKAYKIADNGTVTTNETAILSEYGDFFATEPGRIAVTTEADTQGGLTATTTVHVVKLQFDANHDGTMDGRFHGPDNTAPGRPFVFWVNNDYDRHDPEPDNEDDLPPSSSDLIQRVPDYAYTNNFFGPAIASPRDLEDYARLWTIGTTNVTAGLPAGAVVELLWRTTSLTNPAIRVFRAAEADGGNRYLFDTNYAHSQLDLTSYVGTVGPGSSLRLNASTFGHAPTESFIFCGAARGDGELVLRPRSGATTVVESSAFVQIKDIKEMYERWTVGDSPDVEPLPLAQPYSEGLPAGVTAFTYPYSSARDTNTPYIVFVHGWNNDPYGKDRRAETSLKRLYWQGYQGRFGIYRWPTTYNFPVKAIEGDGSNLNNFDTGEFQAWKSGQGLRRLLVRLNNRHPGHIRVFSHSLGGIVSGEAFRQATRSLVSVYVAMQTAVASHDYDPNAPVRQIQPTRDDGTPNYHANYSGNGVQYFRTMPGASQFVNFYNPDDSVLGWWRLDQDLKPADTKGYEYDGSTQQFFHDRYTGQERVLTIPADTYELFAYCVESRCFALGAQANVGGVFDTPRQVDLQQRFGFDNTAKGHSGQFRSTNMKRWPFWDELLKTFDLKAGL